MDKWERVIIKGNKSIKDVAAIYNEARKDGVNRDACSKYTMSFFDLVRKEEDRAPLIFMIHCYDSFLSQESAAAVYRVLLSGLEKDVVISELKKLKFDKDPRNIFVASLFVQVLYCFGNFCFASGNC